MTCGTQYVGIGQGPFISEPSSVMNIDNIITVTVKSRSEIPPSLGRIRRSSCRAHVDGFSPDSAKGLSSGIKGGPSSATTLPTQSPSRCRVARHLGFAPHLQQPRRRTQRPASPPPPPPRRSTSIGTFRNCVLRSAVRNSCRQVISVHACVVFDVRCRRSLRWLN